jgi:hypothetical protein
MNKNYEIGITKRDVWDEKWKDIFDHYQQDVRHAYYINAILDDFDKKVLEVGAGSFRDMAFLNNLGVDCWGTDYSLTSVNLAKQHFPLLSNKMFVADAFNFDSVKDKEYDVSFHNGLWVLFDNNDDILRLAKEQSRISKNKIVVTVHNGHNQDFTSYFEKLSLSDSLYKIRFFKVDEIKQLMLSVCKSVKVIPVGKGKKFYEDELIAKGNATKENILKLFDEAGLIHLESSERLLCIGYL